MWVRRKQPGIWLTPAAALGLFGGRVLNEQLALGLIGAIGFSFIFILIACSLWYFFSPSHTWPLLLLLLYVVYPEPAPRISLIVGAVTGVMLWQGAEKKWLKQPWPRIRPFWVSGLLAAAFLFVYVFTIAPGLLAADNGEFQLIATNLGVAHPPGFPLYTLLAHAMTRLPFTASPATKVNLLSALTSTITLGLIYATVYRLTRRHLAGVTAVIAMGTATTFWAQATIANIRSLTGLFAALAIYALVRFWEAKRLEIREWRLSDRSLILFAVAMSFGFTHHLSLAFMGVVFVLFGLLVDPGLIKMPRRWIRPLLATLPGLLPLLYLPLRAHTDARGAKASLATIDGFFNHFLALGFQGDFFYFIAPSVLWQRLKVMGNVMTFQFSPWLLLGMSVGFLLLLWREKKLALLLGGSFAIHTLVTAMYRAPQTVEYMLPAYVPLAIMLGYGVGQFEIITTRANKTAVHRTAVHKTIAFGGQLLTAVMFVAAIIQGWQHWPSYRDLHQNTSARDYAQSLLQQAPPGSLILANWHWVTPLWYLQEVESHRPDVTVSYVAPEAAPYGETWAQRIMAAYADGRPVIATWFDDSAYASLPPPEPLGEAFLFRQEPRTYLPDDTTPLDVMLNNDIHLRGYHLDPPQVEIGQETIITLAWEPISNLQSPISLYAHLIGADGRLYAQSDLQIRPQPAGITLTQFRLTPRLGTLPGDYAIIIGSDDTRIEIVTLPVTAMKRPPLSQHPISRRVAAESPWQQLVGYDWDNTLPGRTRLYLHWQTETGYVTEVRDGADAPTLPATVGVWGITSHQWSVAGHQLNSHYVPLGQGIIWIGTSISNLQSPISFQTNHALTQTFLSSQPLTRDLVISVRLIGFEADGFHWAWCDLVDSVPAMGGIPTLKWIRGSAVYAPRQLIYAGQSDPPLFEAFCQSRKPAPGAPVLYVDPRAEPGQTIGATLVLYDAFTKRPLPILDERITAEFAWIPLGMTTLAE